ncbi:hypothetical protein J1605_006608 [Eschrichtius robustus]|uniref:Uncharacterized protein n=1 Tax=Eschrichtius robustus TaxID=9764 RepID=A0AB34H3M7_ESCRO|nr:hypothetical protein J1605_006608 [Eschrichtius robustus]
MLAECLQPERRSCTLVPWGLGLRLGVSRPKDHSAQAVEGFSPTDAGSAALFPAPGPGLGLRVLAAGSARSVRWSLAAPPAFASSRALRAAAALRSRALPEPPHGQPAPRRRSSRPPGTPTPGVRGRRGGADWAPGPGSPRARQGALLLFPAPSCFALHHRAVSIRASPLSPALPEISSPSLRTPRRSPRQAGLKSRRGPAPERGADSHGEREGRYGSRFGGGGVGGGKRNFWAAGTDSRILRAFATPKYFDRSLLPPWIPFLPLSPSDTPVTHLVLLNGFNSSFKDCSNGCSAECPGEAGSKEVVETFKRVDVQLLFFNGADFPPQAKDLIITPATVLKEKPDPNTLVFGTVFTDHMLTVEWSSEFGWEKPHIKPLQNLSLHPGSSAFHYAVEVSTWELMMATYLVFTGVTK